MDTIAKLNKIKSEQFENGILASSGKVRVYKFYLPDVGGKSHIVFGEDATGNGGIGENLREMEVGDRCEIVCDEMTKEAFDLIPDFEGW